jgi:threonyl-tRNA synthetase
MISAVTCSHIALLHLQVSGVKLGKGIRNAELEKVPVIAVLGPRDIEQGVVSVRTYKEGEIGHFPVDDFIARLEAAINSNSDFTSVT